MTRLRPGITVRCPNWENHEYDHTHPTGWKDCRYCGQTKRDMGKEDEIAALAASLLISDDSYARRLAYLLIDPRTA